MKNLLLSLTTLLATGGVMAQLYVTPNSTTSTDSYVYVSDNVLFVEQDVNLVANTNNNQTKSSVYLRNDAQLVQGTTNSANSGTGTISVYQDSFSDAYDYNFWCSPVGNSSGTGNRNSGVGRFFDAKNVTWSWQAGTTTAHNGWSTPKLTIATEWLQSWNPTTQRWFGNGTSNNVPPGYGFTMKGTDVTSNTDPHADTQNQNYDFRGRPNNGDIVIPVQTASIPFTDGTVRNFSLTGNPYPSALDLNLVFNDVDNVEIDAFRFWDEDRTVNSHLYEDNKGGYGTWIPGTNPYVTGGNYTMPTFLDYNAEGVPTGTSSGMGTNVERLFAPIGQGFMVRALPIAGEDGQIVLKNSHRVFVREGAGNDSEFKRPDRIDDNGDVISSDPELPAQIRIHTVFGGNSHLRDMLLLFHETSTDYYDRGLDATHPMDGALAEAYFTIGDSPGNFMNLVIQTIPFDDARKMVPIAFKLDQQMSLEVKVVEQTNTPFVSAWLFDILHNTYSEITNDGSVVNPTGAQLTLDAGTYEDRFFITFRSKRPPYDGQIDDLRVEASVEFFQNNPAAQLEVGNPEGYNIKKVQIFDMTGKLVLTQENLGKVNTLTFPTANFSDGTYLVKLNTAENLAKDYKISVYNK